MGWKNGKIKESNNSSKKKEVDIREVFYTYFFIKYFFLVTMKQSQ